MCAIVAASMRPRIDYSPLLRDLPGNGGGGGGFGDSPSLLGRSGYGAVGSSVPPAAAAAAAEARGGDIEVTTFARAPLNLATWGGPPPAEKQA